MAQEKKPAIRIPADASISAAPAPGWLEWINNNAEGLIGAAGMVAGGPGGAGKKVALKAAPKVAKALPKIKSSADLGKIPAEMFDDFIAFTQKQEPRGGVLGSSLEEIIGNLWKAYQRGAK